jgi:hypothetical protein
MLAQIVKGQEYKKDPKIDKYVGVWEWVSGNSKFQIILSKQKLQRVKKVNDIVTYYYGDVLVGWHCYVKNGQTIENSMDKVCTHYTTWDDADGNSTLMGGASRDAYTEIFFNDLTKNKWGKARLEMLPCKTNEARWTLKETHGDLVIIIPDKPEIPKGFSVPTDVVMTKISSTVPAP